MFSTTYGTSEIKDKKVKFVELTIDTFRMLQCLEWEPSGSFYQKQLLESHDNVTSTGQSATSALIDINLVADMTDPYLPPNPKKVKPVSRGSKYLKCENIFEAKHSLFKAGRKFLLFCYSTADIG
ncbi:hypothetical protein L1987_59104 [Smallanthus sonchifolius]|uniref:Uncharacterized protein n=1 Tax=Smallanthus sonchifolius TaxID=185202 RepID=A0ACB9D559_9ASTR|nr:hypothetical protein L1987_59104 [Smallanthus sonchifolius]